MGVDKALMPVDGVAMAERVARVLESTGCAPVVFVGGAGPALTALGRPWMADRWPGAGPVGGVVSALAALDRATMVVVVACDLPDLTAAAVAGVIAGMAGEDAGPAGMSKRPEPVDVSVADSGRLEPMLACWSTAAASRIEELLTSGHAALHDVIGRLEHVRVRVEAEALRNVNHPDDLLIWRSPRTG